MPPIPPLFTLPIPSEGGSSSQQSQGNFICTQPKPQVYLLSFSSPPDNRLTPAFNATFLLALDAIEQRLPRGVVVTTSSIGKFYSNGLDYEKAIQDPNFFKDSLYPLWRRLITFPMPTIALMNGHAFAGGLMTAMMHDYRIMNSQKGFVCLNELDFGAPLSASMASVFRVKLSMSTMRNMLLESKRYPAAEALTAGIIDGVGGSEEALKFIEERKLTQKAKGKSYASLKAEMYREVIQDLDEAKPTRKIEGDEEVPAHRRQQISAQLDQHQVLMKASKSKL